MKNPCETCLVVSTCLTGECHLLQEYVNSLDFGVNTFLFVDRWVDNYEVRPRVLNLWHSSKFLGGIDESV